MATKTLMHAICNSTCCHNALTSQSVTGTPKSEQGQTQGMFPVQGKRQATRMPVLKTEDRRKKCRPSTASRCAQYALNSMHQTSTVVRGMMRLMRPCDTLSQST